MGIGGKALLLKVGDDFRLFVLSAALKLDSAALRKHLGVRTSRFAIRADGQRHLLRSQRRHFDTACWLRGGAAMPLSLKLPDGFIPSYCR